jgi:uncharacterized protein (TIGR02145 family)
LMLGGWVFLSACNEIELEAKFVEGQAIETGGKVPVFSIFELVTVDLGNGDFTDGDLEASTLERVKIPVTIRGKKLSFMVPKLDPGQYKLVFLEKKKPFHIPFEVKAVTLKEDPVIYLETLLKNQQEKITALEKTKNPLSPEKKAILEKDIALLKQNYSMNAVLANAMREGDRTDLAYFLDANKVWLDEISKSFEQYDSVLPNGRLLNNDRVNVENLSIELMQKFPMAVSTLVKHLPKIETMVSFGFTADDISLVPSLSNSIGVVAVLALSINDLLLDIQGLVTQIDTDAEYARVLASDQVMESTLKADYNFDNGVAYELFVSRNYRTVFKGDETSTIPIVKTYLGSFGVLLTAWAKIKSKLPISLSYSPTNPATVLNFNTKSLLVHSDHLSITGISNPKVSGVVTKENGRFTLTFNTSESGSHEFNFKLVYEYQDFGKLEKTLNAAVIRALEYGTFSDPRDGIIYKTVKIGNQTWFAENLRYEGNIPEVRSQQEWAAIFNTGSAQPAWSNYANESGNDAIYGKLYNWYAVNTGSLCPPGWHIPTDAEWTILSNFLGGESVAGGKMKTDIGWNSPNALATNESGFSGLPGGYRTINGVSAYLGSFGYWWSSTSNDSNNSWNRNLDSSNGLIYRFFNYKAYGFSCRCIKD